MKVEVIKDVSHSVELILGEISVCINTDEAENLIAQLRAVVPVPSDVQEAAHKAYPVDMLGDIYHPRLMIDRNQTKRESFIEGMLAERERLMKDAIECNVIWYDGRLLDITQEQLDAALDKIGAGVDAKVSVIIIKKEK